MILVPIKDNLEKLIIEFKQSVTLDECELLGEEKVAATVSTPHLMGSIEILKELTTDLLIIEFDSEDVIYSESYESVSNSNELVEILSTFLNKINDTEKKYMNSK